MNAFLRTLTSKDAAERNRPFAELTAGMSTAELLQACEELDTFRRRADNLYERVRAAQFLYAAYRFQLMESPEVPATGVIPYEGFEDLLARRFEEAISRFRAALTKDGPNSALFSALAESYHSLTFQTLADQVRRSVRASTGNQWMFRVGHADDHSVRIHPTLLKRADGSLLYPFCANHSGASRPDPQRMDRIFFSGNGLSRRRTGH